MAAGSVFGVVYGLMLTVTGKIIGETIAYYMAKLLGRDGIQMFVGEKRMDRMMKAFNSEKAYVFTFVFYLILIDPNFTNRGIGLETMVLFLEHYFFKLKTSKIGRASCRERV